MREVCDPALTQSGTVFYEVFEFVSDDEEGEDLNPSQALSEEVLGCEQTDQRDPTRISPRDMTFCSPLRNGGKPPACAPASRTTFGNMKVMSAASSVKSYNDDQIRIQTLKQRIEAFEDITASKISTGSIPEVLPLAESLPPRVITPPKARVERKQSLWRRPYLLPCVKPASGGHQTPRLSNKQRRAHKIKSQAPSQLAPATRGSFGILKLAKKFVEFRWLQMKKEVDRTAAHKRTICTPVNDWKAEVSAEAQQYRTNVAKPPHPPRPTIVASRTQVLPRPSSAQSTVGRRATHNEAPPRQGLCDTWDCLQQTKALRKEAMGQFPSQITASKPHFGEARRRSNLYQTWHGDIGEASSPVQRRNADVMQSLSEINVAREQNSLCIDNQQHVNDCGGMNSNLGKHKNAMNNRDIDEEEQECLDSLHPQIPVTPLGGYSEEDGAGSREAEEEIEWLGEDSDMCRTAEDSSAIMPVKSASTESGSLEKYCADRLMPQDPMLCQKLLFDTLFETCGSLGVDSKASCDNMKIQSVLPAEECSENSANPANIIENRGLTGSWCRDEDASDRPEDVCDAAALKWLVQTSGKHSNHLKIEVHNECIAVTGQIQGGFDHTKILHLSAKGHEAKRRDGRPGNMKIWIETIPSGFRERNSWSSPNAGAKMDEYELSKCGKKLVVTTHVTFKLGRNCRLRSVFRRIGSGADAFYK